MIYLRRLNSAIQQRDQAMTQQRQAAAVLVYNLKRRTQSVVTRQHLLLAMGLALGLGASLERLSSSARARRCAQQLVHLWSLSLALPRQWTHALKRWLFQA